MPWILSAVVMDFFVDDCVAAPDGHDDVARLATRLLVVCQKIIAQLSVACREILSYCRRQNKLMQNKF